MAMLGLSNRTSRFSASLNPTSAAANGSDLHLALEVHRGAAVTPEHRDARVDGEGRDQLQLLHLLPGQERKRQAPSANWYGAGRQVHSPGPAHEGPMAGLAARGAPDLGALADPVGLDLEGQGESGVGGEGRLVNYVDLAGPLLALQVNVAERLRISCPAPVGEGQEDAGVSLFAENFERDVGLGAGADDRGRFWAALLQHLQACFHLRSVHDSGERLLNHAQEVRIRVLDRPGHRPVCVT
mmetsp:Transcript_107232/g.313564  ORF Transcript_107232/g.313564 Transcript_107232/m.313564 type:complete len:241 (+) Transcript_107232:108-830(+)